MRIVKNRTFKSSWNNLKGQAVIEYVLLLLMVLIVFLGIIVSIARSTQILAENYYGAYFRCLLELGELPALGSDGVAETECDDMYQPFTVDSGRPLVINPSVMAGNSGDGSGNSGNSGGDSASDSDDSSGNGSSGRSSESGATISAGSSGLGGDGMGGRTAKVPLSEADKKKSAGAAGSAGSIAGVNNFEQSEEFDESGGRTEYVPIYGTRQSEEEEKESNKNVKADLPENQEQSLRGKRVPTGSNKTDDGKEVAEDEISFPDFIKFLIIAAIILIILIFFGGQVMQYQKSQD